MKENKTKESSRASKTKTILAENLWVIALVAPLLIMLMLGVQKLRTSNKESSSYVSSVRTLVTAVNVEITSSELAKIIARPIGKLLLMRVYFEDKKSARVTAYEFDDFHHNGIVNLVLASQNTHESLFVKNIEYRKVADRY